MGPSEEERSCYSVIVRRLIHGAKAAENSVEQAFGAFCAIIARFVN